MDKDHALAPAKEMTPEQKQFAPRKVIGPRDMLVDTQLGKIKVEPAVEVKVEAAAQSPSTETGDASEQWKEVIVKEEVDIEVDSPTPATMEDDNGRMEPSQNLAAGTVNSGTNATPGKAKGKKRRAAAPAKTPQAPQKKSSRSVMRWGYTPKPPKKIMDMLLSQLSDPKPS